MSFFDFFVSSTLANPEISLERAREIVRDAYGRDGDLALLGSQQDYNVRVGATGDTIGRTVLKVANSAFHARELEAQNAAMSWVACRVPDTCLPVVVPALDGTEISTIDVAGESCAVRMVTYVEGEVLAAAPYLSPAALTGLGDLVAAMSAALADFDHDGLDRTLQWDLRQANRVVDLLLPHVSDPARVAALTAAVARSEAVLAVSAALPVQPIHGDLTEDNVVGRHDDAGRIVPGGVIDFGDLARSWRIGDLAVACASLLYRSDADPMAVLPVIRGFDARLSLTDHEIDALWPLVVERAAVLVVSGQQQISISPDNEYAERSQERDWSIFECATSVPLPAMSAALRHGLGRPPAPRPDRARYRRLLPSLDPACLTTLDLSPTSASLDAGRWLDDDAEEAVARRAMAQPGAVAMTRYGECRLTRSRPDVADASPTCALHVEIRLPTGQAVVAPFDGELRQLGDGRVRLAGQEMSLLLSGVELRPEKDSAVAGQQIGSVGPGSLRIQLCSMTDLVPPEFCLPQLAAGWFAVCPDPSGLLGLDVGDAALVESLPVTQRDAFAAVQEHYYQVPPQIERGWRHHLVDVTGRVYVDMINNVTVVGHGHPRLAAASARQWSLLNTNSRFHYGVLGAFADRLASLAPDGLDTVFLVNSGTEANDLALRLAGIHTGRRDVVAILEAYHGWSVATDAVSTSVADNPQALVTRPDWVHTLRAPNNYRGDFHGDDAAERYVEDAVATLRRLAASGTRIGAFIAEPYYGNAGGIPLPDGYLRAVYDEVRRTGGVCIADEVQVGYGRLGEFFWGFEQQRVVPDIITVAKGMGNGQPLGAVICRREIADSFAREGYFFSSAGASPVSCRSG